MGTLSNFASIYCFITFIMGAVFMFIAVCVVAIGKIKNPKIQFYVKRVYNFLELYVKDKYGNSHFLYYMKLGDDYLIDTKSFRDMKHNEIREVNLMKD